MYRLKYRPHYGGVRLLLTRYSFSLPYSSISMEIPSNTPNKPSYKYSTQLTMKIPSAIKTASFQQSEGLISGATEKAESFLLNSGICKFSCLTRLNHKTTYQLQSNSIIVWTLPLLLAHGFFFPRTTLVVAFLMVSIRATVPYLIKSRPELIRQLLDYEVRLAILLVFGMAWKLRSFWKGKDVFKKLLL